jgi:predicted phosphodiesterase
MNKTAYLLEQDAKIFEFMGIPTPYKRPDSRWKTANPEKILSIADMHEPYGNELVYAECELKHKDADILIVPGDLGDYYSKSRFRKTKHVSFRDELRSVFYRMEWMSTHWKRVRIMIGNHDNRPEKQIADAFCDSPELLIVTEQNLLKRLATNFDNIEIVGTQIDGGPTLTHVWQYGDIVFTHAERSMTQKSALMGGLSQQLFRWKDRLGLKPYRFICQGHNHFDLKMTMGGEVWMLLPTASNPYSIGMEYAWSTRFVGDPVVVGYSIFHQSGGETDSNNSYNVVVKV